MASPEVLRTTDILVFLWEIEGWDGLRGAFVLPVLEEILDLIDPIQALPICNGAGIIQTSGNVTAAQV